MRHKIWDANVNHIPVRIFDADGKEWTHVFWIDLQTGEAEVAVLNEHGHEQFDGDGIARERVMLKLPLAAFFYILWRDT